MVSYFNQKYNSLGVEWSGVDWSDQGRAIKRVVLYWSDHSREYQIRMEWEDQIEVSRLFQIVSYCIRLNQIRSYQRRLDLSDMSVLHQIKQIIFYQVDKSKLIGSYYKNIREEERRDQIRSYQSWSERRSVIRSEHIRYIFKKIDMWHRNNRHRQKQIHNILQC